MIGTNGNSGPCFNSHGDLIYTTNTDCMGVGPFSTGNYVFGSTSTKI